MYHCVNEVIQWCGEGMQFDNNVPIYIQIMEELEIDIISGNIACGERLLSVRELAINLKVNPNTIQRALASLEEKGLIYTERTNGKFVTKDKALIEKYRTEYAEKITRKYLENMRKIGFEREYAINFIIKFEGDE